MLFNLVSVILLLKVVKLFLDFMKFFIERNLTAVIELIKKSVTFPEIGLFFFKPFFTIIFIINFNLSIKN